MKARTEQPAKAERQAPIAAAFEEIVRRLDCLQEEVARLEDSLEPVLAGMVPNDPRDLGDVPSNAGSSSLGRAAFDLAARVEDVELRLGSIRRRVEL